jgi:pimeloyl-ACP methyl ester carboxylesterase
MHAARDEFVDLDGGRVHVRLQGEGAPTIVLEAGLGGYARLWDLVAPLLTTVGTVLTYDRPGLGESDPTTSPRTAERQADQLHQLLTTLGVPMPYVLVGHSMGAFIVQAVAVAHPDDTLAVVLVDPSHEDPRRYGLPPWKTARLITGVLAAQVTSEVARIARRRARPSMAERARASLDLSGIPPQVVDEVFALAATPMAVETVRLEGKARLANFAYIKSLRTRPFPAVPLIVLAAGKTFRDLEVAARWVGIPSSDLHAMFRARAVALARLSPHGRVIDVAESGHMMNIEAPSAVASAVDTAIQDARRLQLATIHLGLTNLATRARSNESPS